eukprot:Rhum_TRINITY_DN14605_c7_g1::Rhum_TRINITY_DN14605_c7_g1_i5::g.103766::m.103766
MGQGQSQGLGQASRGAAPGGAGCLALPCVGRRSRATLVKESVARVVFAKTHYDCALESIAAEAHCCEVPYTSAVFLAAIRRVYDVANDAAAAVLRADIVADNPDETQTQVPVFDSLCVSVLRERRVVQVTPVPGTDVDAGFVTPSAFYAQRMLVPHGARTKRDADSPPTSPTKAKRRVHVSYAQALLHVMGTMLEALQEWEASGCQGDDPCPRFTDYFLQVLEACFNCVGRHKEAFEHIVRGYIEMRQREADCASAIERDAASEKTGAVKMHFGAWLDAYKIHALRAAVIDPLLFLLRHRYDVWENIESHGMSFWSTIVEAALDIPMPLERLGSLDTGWGWGARFVDDDKELHAEVLRRCAENVGVGWRSALRGLKAPRKGADVPKLLKMNNLPVDIYFEDMPEFVDYLSEQRLPTQILEKLASTLQRFAAHLSAERIAKRFTLHLINRLDTMPPCVQALQPTQYLDATDPEDVQYDMDGLFSMLASVGVPLRETVTSFKKPKGRGKATQRGVV